MKLEVCIDSVASALAAETGGASRVELCNNLIEGGTTPNAGMIKLVREKIIIGLQVMIRPRGGDFLYSEEELAVMKEDILAAKSLGANGVVFGCLTADGSIDNHRCTELVALARPMNVTFHRAFDMVKDPFQSLEHLISLGFDRVLTSGLKPDVMAGSSMIRELIIKAKGRITILAGGGVRLQNLAQLIEETGIKEVHVSGRKQVDSQMQFRNSEIKMGAISNMEYMTKVVDTHQIKKFRQILLESHN